MSVAPYDELDSVERPAPGPLLWSALTRIVGLQRWRALRTSGAWLGWLVGGVLRIRRAQVEEAMGLAGVHGPRETAAQMYRALGSSAVEFLWLAAHAKSALAHARMDSMSRERWTSARAHGRGVVIAASHTGNWDLAACALAQEVELLVVTKRLTRPAIDLFWQTTRERMGVRLIAAAGALAASQATLARAGAVAMMIDQAPDSRRHASRAAFLGQQAWVDRAPAALAARSRAPMVVAASRREADGEHVLEVLDVLCPPTRGLPRWIDEATLSATRSLEAFVRRYPAQWLWLHRRWKPL